MTRTQKGKPPIKSFSTIVVLSVTLAFLTGVMVPFTGSASAITYSVNKTQSGLVVSDSLTTGNMASLTFGGTATSHNYYEDSQGLHIGVQAPQSGQWVNYYAGLPQSDSHLFHTTITIPDTTVPDGVSNVGLYVEGSDYIPHVACEAYADSTGYYWDVEQSSDAGATYNILYISQPSSFPHTQDCTIITNGSNYLKVYIGGNVVFSSNSMSLGMSTPFIAFVQDDTSSSSSMHYATYRNYYGTSDENIKVINNPSNAATVKIVGSSGQVLASSPVTLGTATLDVGMYTFPLADTINVYDSSNSLIVSSPASIYGGDVFSVTSSAGPPTAPTGLTSNVVSSSQINLSWTAPSDNGGSAITGYKVERSTDNGATWSAIVPNTGSSATTYSDTGLSPSTTYTYRVSAINSAGTSSASNTASATTSAATSRLTVNTQDLSGATISGLYIELWQNSIQINSGFSPATFTLNNGQQYIVKADNYQNYVFDQWNDNSISPSKTIIPTADTTLIAYYQTGPTITAPQPPTGLAATAASSSQINLSWTAPSNNGGSAITGYKVERSIGGGAFSILVANTGTTATTYSDTGLSPSTTYTYRVSAINSAGTSSASNTASATTLVLVHSITQIQSGLMVSDPLNNETQTQQQLQTNSKYWKYGGDAPDRGAPYIFSRDNNGLHIGVQAPANGSWAGFYSASPNSNAMLYHAIIKTPVSTLSAQGQYYENGMYIQTAQPFINYVTCSSITGSFGMVWAVVSSLGNATQGNQFTTLWYDTSPNQPLTRDCTIITNGTNYLKVYMDGKMVYENKTMNLQMPPPFNTYLEPQTSYAGQMLVGSYLDYYAAASENVKITNLPSNSARVDLVNGTGNAIASVPVSSSTVTVDVGKYHLPLIAGIKVYDSGNTMIASSSGTVNVFGGDIYSVS